MHNIYYLAEVYWTKKKKNNIKKFKFYAIIISWKTREEILNKVQKEKIIYDKGFFDSYDYFIMKKDLSYFKKVLKIKPKIWQK